MRIGDDMNPISAETAKTHVRDKGDPRPVPGAPDESSADARSDDAVAPGVGRDLVRLAHEVSSPDRQAKIEEIQLRVASDEYSVDARAVSRAIVDEMIEGAQRSHSRD